MPQKNYNKNNVKIINWCELSSVMTGGNPSIVRSNFVKKDYEKEVDKLMRYIDEFVKRNKKVKKVVERATILRDDGVRKYVKAPKQVQLFKVLDKLPKGAEKININLFQKGENYYTYFFDLKNGFDIKEWYNLEKANEYINEKTQ